MADVLMEPRAFWSTNTTEVTTSDTDPQTVLLNREHFYNGERYPITIDTVCVSMINYIRKTFSDPGGVAGPAAGYSALSNILANFKIVISARNRQSYARYPINASAFVNTATDLFVPYYGDTGATPQQFSSFFGTIHRRFEPHLWVPKNGTLEFDLTPYSGVAPSSSGTKPSTATATVAFHELGTLFGGNMRIFTFDLRDASTSNAAPFGTVISPEAMAASQVGPTTTALWPPQHTISPRSWKSQSPAAQGSAEFTGMSILIDQIDYDDLNLSASAVASPMAMLANRIGCRARLTDGGTKAWWWRPGAPLPLVFPDITPALVCRLDRKITMGPGEQLEVELTVPAVTTGALTGGDDLIPATYEFGLALNGYCVVSG